VKDLWLNVTDVHARLGNWIRVLARIPLFFQQEYTPHDLPKPWRTGEDMKGILLPLRAVLISIHLVAQTSSNPGTRSDEDQIVKVQNALIEAYLHHDYGAVGSC
jgi:hypothetical protein